MLKAKRSASYPELIYPRGLHDFIDHKARTSKVVFYFTWWSLPYGEVRSGIYSWERISSSGRSTFKSAEECPSGALNLPCEEAGRVM